MELTICLDDITKRAALFGSADRNLRVIRGALGVSIAARDSAIKLSGGSSAVGRAAAVIERLQTRLRDTDHITDDDVVEAISAIRDDFEKIIVITHIDELKDAFPTRIDVWKTDEGSQVAIR